ncbi:unnamed protein product, partial [Laminaria digitata]
RYKGYSFTGCGAHVDYKLDVFQGAGYERTWCYVTSPDNCPGEDPYIPEGFKDDNTLPEWKEAGAAWKECYDGYRCEAWWGSLSGQPQGDPVVLNAPLDWPDCCALCSDTSLNDTTTGCAGWSFQPNTGSCQLMTDVSLDHNVSISWGVNGTVNGYPGYFEAPVTGCWSRGRYDLCNNLNLGLLIPGVILAFFGLWCVCGCGIMAPWNNSSFLRELLREEQTRLQKASCVEVSATVMEASNGKGGLIFKNVYEGTFMTRDGALFVVSKIGGKVMAPPQSRSIEQKMLSVLFTTRLKPLANQSITAQCQTPQGLRSAFLSLVPSARAPEGRVRADSSPRFDCLLLVGGSYGYRQHGPARKVLLVGILGEDRLTCYDAEMFGFSVRGNRFGGITLVIASTLLIILCVALLTSEAAQVMAAWTFDGTNYRAGAVVGLVLSVSIPFALLACVVWNKARITRLIEEYP